MLAPIAKPAMIMMYPTIYIPNDISGTQKTDNVTVPVAARLFRALTHVSSLKYSQGLSSD